MGPYGASFGRRRSSGEAVAAGEVFPVNPYHSVSLSTLDLYHHVLEGSIFFAHEPLVGLISLCHWLAALSGKSLFTSAFAVHLPRLMQFVSLIAGPEIRITQKQTPSPTNRPSLDKAL